MATYQENLETARDNLAAALVEATANPKPNYTVDGQSVSWGDYLDSLQKSLDGINAKIAAGEPFEFTTQIM